MFVNKDYEDYEHIVEVNDNYVTLTKRSSVNADWQRPIEIDVIHQYINPSILTIEDTMTFTSSRDFESIETSSNFFDRADCPNIIIASMCVILFVLFIINGLTRFVRKGGVFFGE